jgi:MerR family transcriptional regulator, redox-sensitive transcriptional activator SoxR
MTVIVVVKVDFMSKCDPRPDGGDALTIGEVARRTGRRPSSVRYYEQIGLLPAAARVAGRRVYGPGILRTLAVIETGQRAGLTLEEISALLVASPDDAAAIDRLREVAERKLPEVTALIERSQLVREWLECAARCECPSLDQCPLFEDPALLPARDDADTNGPRPGRRQS